MKNCLLLMVLLAAGCRFAQVGEIEDPGYMSGNYAVESLSQPFTVTPGEVVFVISVGNGAMVGVVGGVDPLTINTLGQVGDVSLPGPVFIFAE